MISSIKLELKAYFIEMLTSLRNELGLCLDVKEAVTWMENLGSDLFRDTHRILFDPRIHKRLYELSLKKNES